MSISTLMLIQWYRKGRRGARGGEEPLIIAQDDVEEAVDSRGSRGDFKPTVSSASVNSEVNNESYDCNPDNAEPLPRHQTHEQQQQQTQQSLGSLWPHVQAE